MRQSAAMFWLWRVGAGMPWWRPTIARLVLPIAIVAVALVPRVGVTFLEGLPRNMPSGQYRQLGGEAGAVARSIADGKGFSSPLSPALQAGETGPTAMVSPVYPYLLAGVYKIFGTFTARAAAAILLVNCVLSALTCLPVMAIAGRLCGSAGSKLAGVGWALLPYAIWYPSHVIQETSLGALLLAVVLWAAIGLQGKHSLRAWAALGLLLGATALANAQSVASAPFILAWLATRLRRAMTPWLAPVGVALAVAGLVVLPWLVRNTLVFGQPTFIRSNFGAELYLSYNPQSQGPSTRWLWLNNNQDEMARYRQIGEAAYMQEKQQQALAFIATHPARSTFLVAKRLVYVVAGTQAGVDAMSWPEGNLLLLRLVKRAAYFGFMVVALAGVWLMWRARRPEAILFTAVLASYLLVEIILYPTERHRHVVEPAMAVLCTFAVLWAYQQIRNVVHVRDIAAAVQKQPTAVLE